MAQDRLEECLQAVAARKDTGAVKRGGRLVNSVDLTLMTLKNPQVKRSLSDSDP